MSLLQSTARWVYRVFWYSLVTAIILLAVAVSMIRIFLPDVKVYREQIEELASAFLEQEVRIESMDARLSGITPLIIFKDVHMLDAEGENEIARFDEARLGFDLWRSITSGKLYPKSLTVYGVSLGVILNEDGSLTLRGLDLTRFEQQLAVTAESATQSTGELARWLFERSELSLRDSTVVWQNVKRNNRRIRFDHVNLDLRNDGDRHQLTGRVSLPEKIGREIEMALDFNGDVLNPRGWQGGFYARGSAIQLENWGVKPILARTTIDQGMLDVSLWGKWHAGQLTSLSSELDARSLRFTLPAAAQPIEINRLKGLFDWSRDAGGWVLQANDMQYLANDRLWPATRLRIAYNEQPETPSLELFSSFLRVQDVIAIVQHAGMLDDDLQQTLAGLEPAGDLEDLYLSYARDAQQSVHYRLSANLRGLGIQPWKKFPGFTALDGVLSADEKAGMLVLRDTSVQLSVPTLFREHFSLSELKGRLDWWHAPDGWQLRSQQLTLATADLRGELSFKAAVPADGTSPWLDLQANFQDGDVQETWRYLPVGIMDAELVQWLDRSLRSGRIRGGQTLFNGRLADFPFRDQQGTFITAFEASDVELEYRTHWPLILIKDGQARFTGTGMDIVVHDGSLYESTLHDTRIGIEEFRLPVLAVRGELAGNFSDVVRFLVESPIAPEAGSFYSRSQMSGSASAELNLRIPLSERAQQTQPLTYHGKVRLQDAGLHAWGKQLSVRNIKGQIEYSEKGIFSRKLSGSFTGQPVGFVLQTREYAGQHIIELGMQGTLDVAKLPAGLPLKGLKQSLRGRSPWQGLLRFGDPAGDEQVLGSLALQSSLEGIEIDLPAPVGKIGPAVNTIELNMQFTHAGDSPVSLRYGNVFNAELLINGKRDRLQLSKGVVNFATEAPALPQENELLIRGSVPRLEIDVWRDVLGQMEFAANLPSIDKLGVPLKLDMEYLHVITREDDTEGKVEDPREVSLVNGQIRQFRYNDMQLGYLDIKTSRLKDGMRIEKLAFSTPNMQVDGEGSWVIREGTQRTNLLLMVSSEDVGSMVNSLGYQGVIRGGSLRAVLQANWNDSPNRFSYAKLNGSLGVVVNDGILSDVKPGAGRLFGLLSLSELPRRLTLDFNELRQGLNFKQIIGQVDIVDGDAYTNNLRIISPIALVSIKGRTGLARKDFDQDVTVIPNVSDTLPVISWLAWGGQIGALTLLLDQLFGEQMNQSVAAHYRITGSWEQPEIEKLALPGAEGAKPQATE